MSKKKHSYISEIKKQNYPLALSMIEQELAKKRDNPEILYNYAICLSRTGNHKKCVQVLSELVDRFSRFIERDNIFRLLVYSYIQLNQYENALDIITERLKINMDDVPLLSFQAFALEKLGLIENAIDVHKRILVVRPNYKNSLNSLGYLLVNKRIPTQEELQMAIDVLKKALSIEPGNPAYLDSFGVLLNTMGQRENSQKALEKALSKLPGNKEILEHLEFLTHSSIEEVSIPEENSSNFDTPNLDEIINSAKSGNLFPKVSRDNKKIVNPKKVTSHKKNDVPEMTEARNLLKEIMEQAKDFG